MSNDDEPKAIVYDWQGKLVCPNPREAYHIKRVLKQADFEHLLKASTEPTLVLARTQVAAAFSMWVLILLLGIGFLSLLLLSGCATRNQTTVMFKEDESTLINLEGADCAQSGLIVDEKKHTLTEYYTNCNVHKIRKLKDYEIKQW